MRILLIIGLLVVLSNSMLLSQDIRLIDYRSEPNHSKNIDKTGQCLLRKELNGDILTVELLSRNMQYSVTPEFTCTFQKGALRITSVLPSTQLKDTVYYDKKLRKRVTMHRMRMDYSIHVDAMGPKAKREVFRFKGFKSCPETIYLNNDLYPNCPGKDIEYRIYKGDTINRINANGFKQGLWITFYETGEVHERKNYKNGAFQGGKTYDKNGKDLHYVGEFSGGIGSVQVDSLFNK
jgi:hypothetical protein